MQAISSVLAVVACRILNAAWLHLANMRLGQLATEDMETVRWLSPHDNKSLMTVGMNTTQAPT